MAQSDGEPSPEDVADTLTALEQYHERYPDSPMTATLRRIVFRDEVQRPEPNPTANTYIPMVREYVTGESDAVLNPVAFKVAVIYGLFHPGEDGERPVSAFSLLFPELAGEPAVAWVPNSGEDLSRGEWRALSSRLIYARELEPEELTVFLREREVRVVRTQELDDAGRWYVEDYRDLHPDMEADDGADGGDAPEDGGSTQNQSDPNTTPDHE
jgi:hypothetical protein